MQNTAIVSHRPASLHPAAHWILPLSAARGLGLPPADKITLLGAWGFVSESDFGDAIDVGVTRRQLALATGTAFETVKSSMARLLAAGWLRRHGSSSVDLAWATPFTQRTGERDQVVVLGRVYVIEFSDGTVKVGMSEVDARFRIEQHAATARCFGLTVVRQWRSAMHARCDAVEAIMVKALAERHSRQNGGEFFAGGFDLAVAVAVEAIGGVR